MTDGLSLTLMEHLDDLPATQIDLATVSLWIDDQPLSTYAGLLELIGNALYRHGRFAEGGQIKAVVRDLRAATP